MSSDEKALEEFHKKHCHKGLSDDKWYINIYELEKIEQFILKTRQKAREEEHQLLDTHTENETKAHKPNNCTCQCHNKHDTHYPL